MKNYVTKNWSETIIYWLMSVFLLLVCVGKLNAAAAPTLVSTPATLPTILVTEDATAVTLLGSSTVTIGVAGTSADISRITLIVSTGAQTGDILSFDNTTNISGSYVSSTFTFTLVPIPGQATPSLLEYQTAIRSVKFATTNNAPTANKAVTILVYDTQPNATALSQSIIVTGVNDIPVLTLSTAEATSNVAYSEGTDKIISSSIAISDPDGTTSISGATITITDGFQTGEDSLVFANQSGITGSYAAGVLTLSGTATITDYNTALRSILYSNSSDIPDTTTRKVTFVVTDESAGSSVLIFRNITVTAVNDPPTISGIVTTSLSYTENDAATVISATIDLSDPDDTTPTPSLTLHSASISVSANGLAEDELIYPATLHGITGIWTTSTHSLALSGDATVAHYEEALRSIQYKNTSNAPSTLIRTVTFKVNDGNDDSLVNDNAKRTITITAANDAPSIAGVPTTSVSYIELAAATSIFGSSVVITDVDSETLASATLVFDGYQAGEDLIEYTLPTGVTAGTPSGTTTRTIVFSGSVSKELYTSLIESITYKNIIASPSMASRSASIIINDGSAPSVAATDGSTRTILVSPAISFTAGPNLVIPRTAGSICIAPWATVSASAIGPSFKFINSLTDHDALAAIPAIFTALPTINDAGDLFFEMKSNATVDGIPVTLTIEMSIENGSPSYKQFTTTVTSGESYSAPTGSLVTNGAVLSGDVEADGGKILSAQVNGVAAGINQTNNTWTSTALSLTSGASDDDFINIFNITAAADGASPGSATVTVTVVEPNSSPRKVAN